MEDLFSIFLVQIAKSFENKFPRPENYDISSFTKFFDSFTEQLDFFSPVIKNLSHSSFPELLNTDLDLLFSSILSIKIFHLRNDDKEIINELLEKLIYRMESSNIKKEILEFLIKSLKNLKKEGKKSGKIFSFFEIYQKLSKKMNSESNEHFWNNYLFLFDYVLTNYCLRENQNKNNLEKVKLFFSDFNEKIFHNCFIKILEGTLIMPNFTHEIKRILFSFHTLISQRDVVFFEPINFHFFDVLRTLDNILSKSSNKNVVLNEEFIFSMISSILHFGIIPEEKLKTFLVDSNLIKKIILSMEETKNKKKDKKNLEKNIVDLIKIIEFYVNKNFNGNLFEEIYQILDEYVLHLIEPSFNKVFTIFDANTQIFWFEKKYINILIRKALSHK